MGSAASSTLLILLLFLCLGRLGGLLGWSLLALLVAAFFDVLARIGTFLLAVLVFGFVCLPSCWHVSAVHLPHEVVHELGRVLHLLLVALSTSSYVRGAASGGGLSFIIVLLFRLIHSVVKTLTLFGRCRLS